VRYAERARDLAETHPLIVHPRRVALVLPPERAALNFSKELLQAPYLSLGGSLWLVVVQEDRGAGATVIIGAHVARVA